MLVKTYGSAVTGVNANTITVEVNISQGANFYLVGLPDAAVKESQQRIESALREHGYKIPGKKVVINMAPADIRKEGAAYDLTLAIGILAASDQIIPDEVHKYIIMGELSLDGTLQPIKGVLPIAIQARAEGFEGFILPKENAREAAVVNKLTVYGVDNIKEVIDFFDGKIQLEPTIVDTRKEFFENINKFDFYILCIVPPNPHLCHTIHKTKTANAQKKPVDISVPFRNSAAFFVCSTCHR